jgi:hypothetical protein
MWIGNRWNSRYLNRRTKKSGIDDELREVDNKEERSGIEGTGGRRSEQVFGIAD